MSHLPCHSGNLAIQTGGALSGQVRSAAGQALPAAIYIRPESQALRETWELEGDVPDSVDARFGKGALPEDAPCVTDEAGAFSIPSLPAGRYALTAVPLHGPHAQVTTTVTVAPGAVTTVALTLAPTRDVRVTASRSLEGASISAYGPPGLALAIDGEAAFVVRGLAAGEIAALVADLSREKDPAVGAIEVRGGQAEGHMNLEPPARLRGRGVDEAGQPGGGGVEIIVRRVSAASRVWSTTAKVSWGQTVWTGSRGFVHRDDVGFGHRERTLADGFTRWLVLPYGRWTVEAPDGTQQTVSLAPQERRTLTVKAR